MIAAHIKKKALAELELAEGRTENQTVRKGTSFAMFAHTQDTHPKHLNARTATWWLVAVIAALVVVLVAQPIVTDVVLWAGFAIATRLTVVERRRRRRAAHRAEIWQRTANLEAVVVGNSAHLIVKEAAA